MASSTEIRKKITEVIKKRSKVEADIGAAEKKKATKEAEAASKSAKAAKATSPATSRMYLRQAESAQKAVAAEAKKIADLATKRAGYGKDEAALNTSFAAAVKRETTAAARASEKARRAEDRRRHEEQVRAEAARRDDRRDTSSQIRAVETRLDARIAELANPQVEKLRILYATATPHSDLRVSQEIRRVKAAVSAALHRDLVEIEHAPDVTPSDLLDHLTSFQPHVIHFSGHANEHVLAFDDGSISGGSDHTVPISAFMKAVSAPDQPPALVVLNACNSATHLQALLQAVPFAIGMSDEVGDADAITFATRFYRAIADGQSIGAALAIARSDMEMNGLPDHELPTLCSAPGADPFDISLVIPPAGDTAAPEAEG